MRQTVKGIYKRCGRRRKSGRESRSQNFGLIGVIGSAVMKYGVLIYYYVVVDEIFPLNKPKEKEGFGLTQEEYK